MNDIVKYPRTLHLEGSGLQPDDKDIVPFSAVQNKFLVVEEKMDGANSGISFSNGQLYIQSRGHYLTGGPREKQFALLKTWANTYRERLYKLLGEKYIMYGEWLYARHTVPYNNLPHYFMEFDIYDKENKLFLITKARRRILKGSKVVSVKVLKEGSFNIIEDLKALITKSYFYDGYMEGLYIKEETDKYVAGRYKLVRKDFIDLVKQSEHWFNKPIVANKLTPGVSIF